ncbi:acyltransferase family protein [Pseudodesulfovibrio sp. zrk46]|uniref:acyltransferase family protein n=1 Tax=Pseudodesulfovibrio sp. zrk46 TaxID=2725288 RepID=UPI00144976D1|nr:acyltransferase family protein [Pseudodesulfovibrio sp. zrk46]QJB57135.1 acyltransferase family protein [Pseudodesulfovibrio sp. zrk46]
MKTSLTSTGRIPMLDVARFFGMILVYYGHIIERMMYLKNPVAAAQYKFIYSFHMPFFFLLAGFTIAPEKTLVPMGRYLKKLATSRLVPYFFFTIVLALLSLCFAGWFTVVDVSTSAGYLKGAVSTLLGFPVFNIPLWFMACLVSVELIHYAVGRFLDNNIKLLMAAMAFYVAGFYLTQKVHLLGGATYWLLHEALVVYAFYLIGVVMRREAMLLGGHPRWRLMLASAACLLVVVFTWDMNQGPFQLIQAVVIVLSGHGNMLLFPLTALAGSLFVLLAARSAGANRFFMFMGENALILFCLNGVFYHFLNGPFADWFVKTFPGEWWSVTAAGIAFTVVSMAACIPFIYAFNRWTPVLVGKRLRPGNAKLGVSGRSR